MNAFGQQRIIMVYAESELNGSQTNRPFVWFTMIYFLPGYTEKINLEFFLDLNRFRPSLKLDKFSIFKMYQNWGILGLCQTILMELSIENSQGIKVTIFAKRLGKFLAKFQN